MTVSKELGTFTLYILLAAFLGMLLAGFAASCAHGPLAKSPEHPHPTTELVACMLAGPIPLDQLHDPKLRATAVVGLVARLAACLRQLAPAPLVADAGVTP